MQNKGTFTEKNPAPTVKQSGLNVIFGYVKTRLISIVHFHMERLKDKRGLIPIKDSWAESLTLSLIMTKKLVF